MVPVLIIRGPGFTIIIGLVVLASRAILNPVAAVRTARWRFRRPVANFVTIGRLGIVPCIAVASAILTLLVAVGSSVVVTGAVVVVSVSASPSFVLVVLSGLEGNTVGAENGGGEGSSEKHIF